tara:strand:- start:230 stop:1054 length:825 start_codon:yes stop_codon:yes gene_type:complete
MFKKFFRKVRDVAKKAAPIAGIAALAGFGLPMLGGAAPGAAAGSGGFFGGIGNLLKSGLGKFATSSIAQGGPQIGQTITTPGSGILGLLQKGGGLAKGLAGSFVSPEGKATPLGSIASTVLPALAGYYAYSKDKPEPVDTNPMSEVDKRYGSQFGTGRFTDTLVKKTQYNPADGKYYDQISPDGIYSNYTPDSDKGLAMGGIIGLTKGGNPDYPRKQGMINGPGGPKDDMIPAMLSNGEFVFTAKAVDKAGGPRAMYNLMNSLDPESSKGRGGR